jgi:Sortase domain
MSPPVGRARLGKIAAIAALSATALLAGSEGSASVFATGASVGVETIVSVAARKSHVTSDSAPDVVSDSDDPTPRDPVVPSTIVPEKTSTIIVGLPTTTSTTTTTPPPTTASLPQLSIPSIGLTHTILVGDQPQIDQGDVVNYESADQAGCWPGQGCTVWLAGHRTSHGGVFRGLPTLKPGDRLSIRYNGTNFVYTVTGSALVDRDDAPDGFMHGDLMIQTSWVQGQVLLVYADQVHE